MNYLLDAVDRLTLPLPSKVMQVKTIDIIDPETKEVTGTFDVACTSATRPEPLLVMLRDAVAGGIGSHAGSSPGRERIPFDAAALEMFDGIVKRINALYVGLPNAREDRYLQDRLRDWYLHFALRISRSEVTVEQERAMAKQLEGWARGIEAMFDPPNRMELTQRVNGLTEPVPCPSCGNRHAFDPKTGDQIVALVIDYWNVGESMLDDAVARCRFCEEVWEGRFRLRELRWQIDEAEAVAAAGDTQQIDG
jgi:hypothetical protein